VIVLTPCTVKLRFKLAGAGDASGPWLGHALAAYDFEMTLNLDEALLSVAL
jgi:hypothetical protein